MWPLKNRDQMARTKNRAEQVRLIENLRKIDNEKKYDMQLFEIRAKKFRSKFSKLNANPISKPSDIKMFETHLPGFCYKRTGEQRTLLNIRNRPMLEFKNLYKLVFTDGTVDIKKILFLHLISAHKSENLEPPKKRKILKGHLPMTRLLRRSKKTPFSVSKNLTNVLPFYTVELSEGEPCDGKIKPPVVNDGRFAARILINSKLRRLIETVIDTLRNTNREKLEELARVVRQPELLREMFQNEKGFEVFEEIWDNPLISSCESFVLSPPFKIKSKDLVIGADSGPLGRIIDHIRKNVLQLSNKTLIRRDNLTESPINRMNTKNVPEKGLIPSPVLSRSIITALITEKQKKLLSESKNFIKRNIKNAGKTKRIEYDSDEESVTSRRSSISSRSRLDSGIVSKVKVDTDATISEEPEIEDQNTKRKRRKSMEPIQEPSSSRSPIVIPPSHPSKSHQNPHSLIRHTNCPACMQKWKKPLPDPKVSRLKRSAGLPTERPVIRTNSLNRLKMLISKELFKLDVYSRKYSTDGSFSNRSSLRKDQMVSEEEETNLSGMELARISLEIKEKEVKRQLERFIAQKL